MGNSPVLIFCHALIFFEFHPFFYWSTWDASFIYRCLTLVTGQASEAWCPPRTICCWRIVLERGIYISDALVRYYIALLFGWVRLWNQHCFYPFHWKSLIIQMFKMSMFIIFFCVQSEIYFALQNVIFSLLSLEFLTLLCLMCVYKTFCWLSFLRYTDDDISYFLGIGGPQGFNVNKTSHICHVKSNKEWYK